MYHSIIKQCSSSSPPNGKVTMCRSFRREPNVFSIFKCLPGKSQNLRSEIPINSIWIHSMARMARTAPAPVRRMSPRFRGVSSLAWFSEVLRSKKSRGFSLGLFCAKPQLFQIFLNDPKFMDLSILIQLLWDGATNQQRWGLNTIENPAIGCASQCISVNGSFKSTSPNHQVIMVEIFSMPYI